MEDESTLPRSPKLSSSTSSTPENPTLPTSQRAARGKTKPSSSHAEEEKEDEEDAMAISVHVVGHEPDEEPVPLVILKPEVVDPRGSAEKCARRSPRFTTNKFRSSSVSPEANYQNALPALCSAPQAPSLRRSPRLLPQSDGKMVNLEAVYSSKRQRREEKEEEEEAKGSSKKVEVEGKVGNSPYGRFALPEPEMPSSRKSTFGASEKCLRSRNVVLHVGIEKHKVEKTPHKEEKSAFSSEKRLRNRTVTIEKENVEKNPCEKEKSAFSSEKRLKNRTVTIEKENVDKSPREKEKSAFTSERRLRSRTVTTEHEAERSPYEDRKSAFSSEKRLRNRTVTIEKEMAEKSTCEKEKSAFSSEKRLRNRTVASEQENGERSSYREDKSAFVSEKSLRSRAVTIEKEKVEKSASGEKKKDWGVMSEKCLRSRKIKYRVADGVESVDNQILLIKGSASKSKGTAKKSENSESKQKSPLSFIGEPIPEEEATERWRWRYELKNKRTKRQSWILNAGEEDEIILNVKCHYPQAKLGNCIFNIGDCTYVKGGGRKKHVGKILEFFKTTEDEDYFRVQWFFRAEDTVLKEAASFHDKKRLFYSTLMNDNLLDCIISKVSVVESTPMLGLKPDADPPADFYYDMEYCVEYSTFRNLSNEHSIKSCDSPSVKYVDEFHTPITVRPMEVLPLCESLKTELALLDLYSGCGGMSTGLCLGAKLSGINLKTRWAVDADRSACDSLKLNHPETQVRNEPAEDFLELLKRWEKLCKSYAFNKLERTTRGGSENLKVAEKSGSSLVDAKVSAGEYEVLHLVGICFGDPNSTGKRDLYFKVRWKGYGPEDDTWEPVGGLSNCQERLQDFVRDGFKSKILPLPGDVDVICGGPPCQGISGYNRFRNVDAPLDDERNLQIVVFMDIVKFLKPRYVLMENVTDILRFDKGSLGRYALGRLVHIKYQARLGIMAAGCYGLPQFRLRVFIWGALPSERLPQFPLPTHDVIVRYWPPPEFERNTVAYDEGQPRQLEEAVLLRDAISDLPAVANCQTNEEMAYEMAPETEFQKYIRSTKWEMMGLAPTEFTDTRSSVLYDHRPIQLSEDNCLRVRQIPHRKGANFRDFPGVVVGEDNVARRDPTMEPVKLPSGELLIPGCCFTYEQGKSKRPFARLWWDENVATIVTVPNIRSHALLHPEQDRILTIREYARLQGFPDFYRFCGTIKDRYRQVGNAVAVPVARALGYALGMAFQKLTGDEPLMTLPPKFSSQLPLIDEIVVLRS